MAEAIGTLGTAVGVASLGIQVCQGLITYFSAYKDQDAMVQKVNQQTSTLESLLSLSRDLLRSLSQDHSPVVVQVEALVVQCRSSVVDLGVVLERCNRGSRRNGLTHQVQRKVRGARFPFRLESLQNVQKDVGIIQDNLNLAFNLLQLNVSSLTSPRCLTILNSLHSLSPKIQDISDDLSTAKDHINTAVNVLSEIRGSTSALAVALPQLQNNFTHVAQSFQTLLPMVRNSLASNSTQAAAHGLAIRDLEDNIDIQYKNLTQSVDRRLIANLGHHQQQLILISNSQDEQFRDLSAQVSQIPQALVEMLRVPELQPPRMTRGKPRKNAFSSCSCGFDLSTWNYRAYDISLRMWQTSLSRKVHKRNCSLYTPLQRTEVGVTYYGCFSPGIVSLSLTMVKGAGVLSLIPNITYRATVPRTSPAFALMKNVASYARGHSMNPERKDWNPPELLNKTGKDLQQLYQDRMFNPTDVDDMGHTLFHYACDLAKDFVGICNESTVFDAAKNLLLQIQSYNVPTNDIDVHGDGALDSVVSEAFRHGTASVIQLSLEMMLSGVETSETWLQSIAQESSQCWDNFFRNVAYSSQSLIDIPEMQDSLQYGPISRSILKRDEKLVKVHLAEDRSCLAERTLLDQSPLHLSADWPVGISLILAHGGRELVDTVDSAGFLPVSYASYRRCLEGVKLLLEAGSALYSDVVGNSDIRCHVHNVLLDAMFHSSDEIVQCLIWHTADRRRQLHQLAMEVDPTRWKGPHLPDPNSQLLNAQTSDVFHMLESLKIEIPVALRLAGAGDVYDLLFTINSWTYKTVDNGLEYAQMLWDAGFRDVDEYVGDMPSLARKWVLLLEFGEVMTIEWTKILFLSSWLVGKGADISKPDLASGTIPHTPAAHFIARTVMQLKHQLWASKPYFSTQAKTTTVENFITSILQEEAACNLCICGCSRNGCTALIQMLKSSLVFGNTTTCPKASYHKRCQLYSWAKIEECIGLGVWDVFFPTIIRFETFTALELTHTCCTYQDNYFAYYNEEDCAEIREEEDEVLQMLEELVAEFTRIYLERGISVTRFLRGYWQERMDEVMQRNGDVDLEAISKIRETGVVLHS